MPKKVKVGTVVSDKMDKTIVVSVAEHKAHKKYKKTMTFTKKYKASDVNGTSKMGVLFLSLKTDQFQAL